MVPPGVAGGDLALLGSQSWTEPDRSLGAGAPSPPQATQLCLTPSPAGPGS